MTKILCIEDEVDLRSVIVEELEEQGYETLEAVNGLEGLHAILKHKPDLVLCDVTMPEMTGYEVLTVLRKDHPELANMPFLLLTALSGREDVVAGRKLGADDYLAKPIDFDLLAATISSRLAQVKRMEAKKDSELEALRDEILMILPHELRTPLNHILGYSEMISEEICGPIENKDYIDFAKQITAGGKQLLKVVTNVLTLADIASGRLAPQLALCDISTLVTDCTTAQSNQTKDQTGIHFDIPDGLPSVITDSMLLVQALNALISNAKKFSPDGVNVEVSVKVTGERELSIVVADKGIGMSKEKIETALETFSQVDTGLTRSFDGLGLGLPLVVQICKLLDARFDITSVEGSGTQATITLNALDNGN